jgi:hypothetical protein
MPPRHHCILQYDQKRRKAEARKEAEKQRAEEAARRAAQVAAGDGEDEDSEPEAPVFRGSRLWRMW